MQETQLDRIERKLDQFLAIWEEFKPLLERYKQAAAANGALAKRRALRGM